MSSRKAEEGKPAGDAADSKRNAARAKPKYTMTISRLTVDKLGVKLYDKVSAVIAELVANSYDADARLVEVEAPMGQLLATKSAGKLLDKGFEIVVKDNGIGMSGNEVNAFYLKVGGERRNDPARGAVSKQFNRQVMGRKGVGKLAPFGICNTIEVITSGGPTKEGIDESGKKAKGHEIAHLILGRDGILRDTEDDYHPIIGKLDGLVRQSTGTKLILTLFSHRHVPELDDFERQLAQRFGLASPNWGIDLIDTTKTNTDPKRTRRVGSFSLEKVPETEMIFEEIKVGGKKVASAYRAVREDGSPVAEITAGFDYEGEFYPITGWVAYSKQPYKDDLMAGVRIYCHGKIAAQTSIFNHRAGFTGEYDIRSYLIGELHCDWLDETDDLIQTDRRDILWSDELGQAFEKWGQQLVLLVGKSARTPLKKKTWERFKELSKIVQRAGKAFPGDNQKPIRENALELARLVGQTIREGELDDKEHVESLVKLSLLLAPHVTLDQKLREAAESADTSLAAITGLLKTARIAELSSFGSIADERVKVISRVETLKDDSDTLEAAFQELITQAPWLIDPQWSPITANQSFSTLKSEFQKLYKKKMGGDLVLEPFSKQGKRADFVMSTQEGIIQLIEIKKPSHALANDELVRINTYVELLTEFFADAGNKPFLTSFHGFHVTLVCDSLALTGVAKTAFEGLKKSETLTHVNWRSFLLKTKKMHQDFLNEADRQRLDVAKEA